MEMATQSPQYDNFYGSQYSVKDKFFFWEKKQKMVLFSIVRMERRQGKTFDIVELEEAILFTMTIALPSLSYLFYGLVTITYRDVREGIFP